MEIYESLLKCWMLALQLEQEVVVYSLQSGSRVSGVRMTMIKQASLIK